jgi:hypothetical protein
MKKTKKKGRLALKRRKDVWCNLPTSARGRGSYRDWK